MDNKELIERLQGKIESRPKRIDVSVGFKVVEEGKDTWYFADDTIEGMCYKDKMAWDNNDDICYIPESEFDGDGWGMEYKEGLGYTKEEVLNIVRDEMRWNYEGIPEDECFILHIAESLFQEVEWESIGVALDRIDLDEEWEYYQEKHQNKFEIIK